LYESERERERERDGVREREREKESKRERGRERERERECSTLQRISINKIILLLGYIRGVAALMIIGLLTDIFGTLCTGLGLRSTDPNKKYKYYRVAIYALLFTRKS
jgi:hypothetical protein